MVSEREEKILDYMWEQMNNLEEFIRRNGYTGNCMYAITLNPDIRARDVSVSTFSGNNKCHRSVHKESYYTSKSNYREWEG